MNPAATTAALVERLHQATLGALDLAAIYLGDRLGLYRALHALGPLTSQELARAAGVDERHVRVWLEQQAVTGLLGLQDDGRFSLPDAHAEVLLDPDSLAHAGPLARQVVEALQGLPAIADTLTTFRAVAAPEPWEPQAELDRPQLVHRLATEWLPALPDVHARLQAPPAARVADVGCRSGWSSIALARAYPRVRVDGFDEHPAAQPLAERHAEEQGVADRVRFLGYPPRGRYDLVTALGATPDLALLHALVAPWGTVLAAIADLPDEIAAEGDDAERLARGWGLTRAAGVPRPCDFERDAAHAGFRAVEVVPVEDDRRRFYRLTP